MAKRQVKIRARRKDATRDNYDLVLKTGELLRGRRSRDWLVTYLLPPPRMLNLIDAVLSYEQY
jgi:hypothetical protein